MPSTSPSIVYLYGVVPDGQARPARDGAADVALPGMVALADVLPAGEYSGAALQARLQDVAWVAEQARRHTSVLSAAMELGPVVPARLCTLFSGPDALRDALARDADRLQDALARIRGRREWSVKLFMDEERVRAACLRDDPSLADAPATASSGAEWMRRKQRASHLADQVTGRAETAAGEVLDALEALADETRLRPMLSEAASGVPGTMALNLALLVHGEAEAAVQEEADRLAVALDEDGFQLTLSGPWPCFSFCDDGIGAGKAGDPAEEHRA
jgi:hypothetical protein